MEDYKEKLHAATAEVKKKYYFNVGDVVFLDKAGYGNRKGEVVAIGTGDKINRVQVKWEKHPKTWIAIKVLLAPNIRSGILRKPKKSLADIEEEQAKLAEKAQKKVVALEKKISKMEKEIDKNVQKYFLFATSTGRFTWEGFSDEQIKAKLKQNQLALIKVMKEELNTLKNL